ncbi:hypothetical protein GWG54_19930 [Natronococcus sp. JC468]|uniref:HalOD1 output domain-containing protein n=1 Tax=Natronococcus sp. JC468 TaxID=1961921 RepID=UPI00143BEDD8|nr:HalOD1 output domain-containing protein [Natronococcus sp. JC468]NKE38018.1 hypothetical protein [Natronococcus sp. JC468]
MTCDDTPEDDESTPKSSERIRHEWCDTDNPSTAVINAIAAITGRDPEKIPPLYDYADPAALNTLMTPRTNNVQDSISVSFTYEDVEVLVDSSGWVEVQLNRTNLE